VIKKKFALTAGGYPEKIICNRGTVKKALKVGNSVRRGGLSPKKEGKNQKKR